MAEVIRQEEIPDIFRAVARKFEEKKDELCRMDAQMGDGDLGLTMSKGFSALPDILEGFREEQDIGRMLMKAGMKMSGIVPSTMGTLMSSGIMEGGRQLRGCREIDAGKLAGFIEGFAEGIHKRGKANPGERTIYDAFLPAAEMAQKASASGSLEEVIDAACEGARTVVKATETMTPKHGKAAVFAEKAKGVPDQGAVAGMYFLDGLKDGILKREGEAR